MIKKLKFILKCRWHAYQLKFSDIFEADKFMKRYGFNGPHMFTGLFKNKEQ